MKNRLFIIEGIPCTGKTSTAKFISNIINEYGEEVLYYPEGTGNHPADYEFHAFISNNDLNEFSKDEQDIFLKISQQKNNGYIIPLQSISGDLFNKLINYKIYDMLEWEKEYPVMINKWKEFSETAINDDNIYIFDCCFLQNPLCETMMRFNMKQEVIYDYIHSIYECIKDLNPVVIYLKNTKIKERIQDVSKEREKKWLDEVIEYHTSQGYGKANEFYGFDGYVECLKARQEIELSILNNLNIGKIIIENPFENWDESYEIIKNVIVTSNTKGR